MSGWEGSVLAAKGVSLCKISSITFMWWFGNWMLFIRSLLVELEIKEIWLRPKYHPTIGFAVVSAKHAEEVMESISGRQIDIITAVSFLLSSNIDYIPYTTSPIDNVFINKYVFQTMTITAIE